MDEFPSKAVRQRLKCENELQTSYKQSYYYEAPVALPLYLARMKTSQTAFDQDVPHRTCTSVYNEEYKNKSIDYQPGYYGRSSAARPSNLKYLHEKYSRQIIKPIKPDLTTNGLAYIYPARIGTPQSLSQKSPIDDVTCTISSFGRDEFPSIRLNEPGYYKHLDNFVSTTQITHLDFTHDQRNTAKNNIVYNNASNESKHRGLVTKTGRPTPSHSSQNYNPLPKTPFPNISRVMPLKGNRTMYNTDYCHTPRKLILWQPKVRYPILFKSSRKEDLQH